MSQVNKWRLTGISLTLTEEATEETVLPQKIAKALQVPGAAIVAWRQIKKSVDARDPGRFAFIYTLEVELAAGFSPRAKGRGVTLRPAPPEHPLSLPQGVEPLRLPPVVVGAGPAGLFAAWLLARQGYRPLVLEQGRPVEQRAVDVAAFWRQGSLLPYSNVQFGEGGAGAFSDGKLTHRGKDPWARLVFEEWVALGAPAEILSWYRPHLGSDRLLRLVARLRQKIIAWGGRFAFGCRVTDLGWQDGHLTSFTLADQGRFPVEALILAPGNSARELYHLLQRRGLTLAAKPFAIGLRIEHPQTLIDRAQYGVQAGHPRLGAASYELTWRDTVGGRGIYSFCMCPGGYIVNGASEAGGVVTNGISYARRDSGRANSALVATVGPADFGGEDPLAGLNWQRRWEERAFAAGGGDYGLPVQRVRDFLQHRAGEVTDAGFQPCSPGYADAELQDCLPEPVAASLAAALRHWERQIPGFCGEEAILAGVETRTSAPVRIVRGQDRQAVGQTGLYPAGEGAGYAGGIISSAVDGLRAAEALIARYDLPRADFASAIITTEMEMKR